MVVVVKMSNGNKITDWPILSYPEMESTLYLLHRATQVIGKLKLVLPFEAHWGGVALWLTSCGLTSGIIPYKNEYFSLDINFLEHQIYIYSSWGAKEMLPLATSSVAELFNNIFQKLKKMNIEVKINTLPAEVANPIRFEQDQEKRIYQPGLARDWWKALCQIYRVLNQYHAMFRGISPPIGLMWGTLDFRDVRYKGVRLPPNEANADYIRKNAMDDEQIEAGWWCGNSLYTHPAFFSFTYPKPAHIENYKIKPDGARWESSLNEFLLDYEVIQRSNTPDQDLLAFFISTYLAGAQSAGWDAALITNGKPEK